MITKIDPLNYMDTPCDSNKKRFEDSYNLNPTNFKKDMLKDGKEMEKFNNNKWFSHWEYLNSRKESSIRAESKKEYWLAGVKIGILTAMAEIKKDTSLMPSEIEKIILELEKLLDKTTWQTEPKQLQQREINNFN